MTFREAEAGLPCGIKRGLASLPEPHGVDRATPGISGTEASMENDSTVYVGLDVHKESITIAYAIGMGEVELLGKIGTTHGDIDRLCKRLQSKGRRVRVVYEAGPCGYGLYRQLMQKEFDCMVCAPSLIPKKPGERVKTDRRDAIKLVRALRAGDLSAVYVPGIEDEAFRDLARAWAAAKDDLKQARPATEVVSALARCALCGQRQLGPSPSTMAKPVFVRKQVATTGVRRTSPHDRGSARTM